jgi:hypothetical protein
MSKPAAVSALSAPEYATSSRHWNKMATHPVSLLMILHKCHEYYDFCSDLDDFYNMVQQTKSGAKIGQGFVESAISIVDGASACSILWATLVLR